MALLASVVLAWPSSPAHAQEAGKPPLRILVGFPPGASTDLLARLVAERIREPLGQPVIVENRPGAGGRLAAEQLRGAAPDGNTLMLAPIVVTVLAPFVHTRLGYDPMRDFAPVSHAANFQIAFSTGPATGAKTLAEFIAWAKANPKRAQFGTAAAGSLPHFFGVMLERAVGLDLVHVPYKGGAPLLADLIGGHIAASASVLSEVVEQHRAGKLRVLATSGAQRSPLLADVPTFRELGFKGIEGNGWFGYYAPAATPRAQIERLARAIAGALQAPDLRDKLYAMGLEPTGTTPDELARLIAADAARWGPVIKASGFTADD
jgi:tripartite-type tricarboxylate transporter receptor subunit TctC